MREISPDLLDALAVTAALIGGEMSDATARALGITLSEYPQAPVLAALARCQLECKYRLSLADVIERMDDGHPGPEEAWELVPKSEGETAVLTQEIMSAIPFDLIAAGDLIAARMAFRESYARARAEARAERRPPVWFPSLGHDKHGREAPLLRAVQLGRIGREHVQALLPPPVSGSQTVLDITATRWPRVVSKLAL